MQKAGIANVQRLKTTSRTALTMVAVLVLAATPCLQALQLGQGDHSCGMAGCGGSRCNEDSALTGATAAIEGSCCCSVSDPEPVVHVAFEAQPRPASSSDALGEVACVTSDILMTATVPDQAPETDIPSAHGPPLYILNSSYLI